VTVNTQQYWDEVFARAAVEHPLGEIKGEIVSALRAAVEFFGPMRGKTIVDLGCGEGASSLFFAQQAANVVSLDQSEVAIQRLREFCATNHITSIKAFAANAFDLGNYGPVDFVFGSMILHHLEPFEEFVPLLKGALKPNGRAFFHENNSASSLLVWSRNHLVGKLWIPKHGDSDEFPLSPKEVQELAGAFRLRQEFPHLTLFRLLPVYLFRGRFDKPFHWLDDLAFHIRPLRKYSYRQYLFLEKP
jgi:2-polyprenyl-3-methyl-5-hydroxy-6-metoxy-1,4-benzoquinol methylase